MAWGLLDFMLYSGARIIGIRLLVKIKMFLFSQIVLVSTTRQVLPNTTKHCFKCSFNSNILNENEYFGPLLMWNSKDKK